MFTILKFKCPDVGNIKFNVHLQLYGSFWEGGGGGGGGGGGADN